MIVRLDHQRNPGLPSKRKVSSDAPDLVLSGAMHDPVHNKVEKQCGHV